MFPEISCFLQFCFCKWTVASVQLPHLCCGHEVLEQRTSGLAEPAHQAVVKGVLAQTFFFYSTLLPVSKIISQERLFNKKENKNSQAVNLQNIWKKPIKTWTKKKPFVLVDFKVLTNSSLLVNVARHDSNFAFSWLQKDSFEVTLFTTTALTLSLRHRTTFCDITIDCLVCCCGHKFTPNKAKL